jgi:hypothetical protein
MQCAKIARNRADNPKADHLGAGSVNTTLATLRSEILTPERLTSSTTTSVPKDCVLESRSLSLNLNLMFGASGLQASVVIDAYGRVTHYMLPKSDSLG